MYFLCIVSLGLAVGNASQTKTLERLEVDFMTESLLNFMNRYIV